MKRINAHHNAHHNMHHNAHDISLKLKIVVMDRVLRFKYVQFLLIKYYNIVIKLNY